MLGTSLSRRGTPYSSATVGAYLTAVDSLDRWMSETACPAGFDSLSVEVTNGKIVRDRRDHALIRVLLTGARREEVTRLKVEHLALTSAHRSAAVVDLKGSAGRRIPRGGSDTLALRRWLAVRARHRRVKAADSGALWIAERTGDALKGQRYRPDAPSLGDADRVSARAVRPHLFRHAIAQDWRADGGSEADLMALAGWRDRRMVLRCGAIMSEQRAHAAAQRSGFSERY